jgi:hypothetical protein
MGSVCCLAREEGRRYGEVEEKGQNGKEEEYHSF